MSRLSPYRDLGTPGEPYPEWLRTLRGKNGVYVIRESGGARLTLYVGESHSGRLYETATRHFQSWSLPEAKSYARARVQLAVRECSAADAPPLQREYICELSPRDNVYDTCEEVPF